MPSTGLTTYPTTDPPDLEGLSGEERREAILEWWGENFEDPAQSTPYEGGYVWIWGGPYDAREELADAFALDDDELEEIADEIESDGLHEWAPHTNRVRPEEEEDEPPPTVDDLRWLLTEIRAGLDQLRQSEALRSPPAGIGHNGPPEEVASLTLEDVDDAEEAIGRVEAELDQPSPDASVLARAGKALRAFASKLRAWIIQVPGLMAKGSVTAVGAYLTTRYLNAPEKLAKDIEMAADIIGMLF